MRKNQKGFSIVELLIAVAILAVITIAIAGFIIVGSKSYGSINSDINVQTECQQAMNQMSDVMIDTIRSINYGGISEDGTTELVLKDSEFSIVPVEKMLTMINMDLQISTDPTSGDKILTSGDGNGNKNYQFYWKKEDAKLFYKEIPIDAADATLDADGNVKIDLSAKFAAAEENLLASNITDFSIDLTDVEEDRVVRLSLTFISQNREYNTTNNITLRNKVVINETSMSATDKDVEIEIIPKEKSVILEPTETYHFSVPTVKGKNIQDKSVTWSFADGATHHAGTTITDAANGIIKISNAETAEIITLTITSNAVDSKGKHATANVDVIIKRATAVNLYKEPGTGGDDSGPNEVETGSNFTINGAATGIKLGTICTGCKADTSKDKAVTNWRITQGAQYCTIKSTGDDKAEFTVSETAPVGSTIKIQATAAISVKTGKAYAQPVVGEITLNVKDGNRFNYNGEWNWGTFVTIDDIFTKPAGNYIICARMRDTGPVNSGNDKIVIYTPDGHDGIHLDINMYGLTMGDPDWDGIIRKPKTWYISVEIIYPANRWDNNDTSWYGDAINDYLSNSNNATGKYSGSKYKSGGMAGGQLQPPKGKFTYNGNEIAQNTPIKVNAARGTVSLPLGLKDIVNLDKSYTYGQAEVFWNMYSKPKNASGYNWTYGYNKNNRSYTGNQRSGSVEYREFSSKSKLNDLANNTSPWTMTVYSEQNAVGSYQLIPLLRYNNGDSRTPAGHILWRNFDRYTQDQFVDMDSSKIQVDVSYEEKFNLQPLYMYGTPYKMYLPSPYEDEFLTFPGNPYNGLFKRGANSVVNWPNFNVVNMWNGQSQSTGCQKITMTYTKATNWAPESYVATFYDWNGGVMGSFKWVPASETWELVR